MTGPDLVNNFEPIAVVGRACVLPGADSPEALWQQVVAGNDLVSTVPADRWGISADNVLCEGPEDSTDRTWSDRGGYVRGFDERFDPSGFGLPAEEILALDPVFQWTFHTAREALRDAGREGAGERVGAVFGNLSFPSASMAAFTQATTIEGLDGYGVQALAAAGIATPDPRNRFTSGLPALLLEQALGLAGGAMALDAACASSLYAIKLACDRLQSGEVDLMLAGAVNSADDLCIHLGFAALTALSRTGQSRPFNAGADGLVPAEGCGFVALRRLDDALTDGDTIHGVLRGVGLSNDGRGRGMLVPSSDGQRRAMASALAMSGLASSDVSLIECHATGTTVGDATEVESTAAVYGGGRASGDRLPIGSLKSNMGHLITAAGVAGLIKVLEAMKHETRPPTLHVDEPLTAIADSPFRLLAEAEPWERPDGGALRAGVSAFGFGGNNAHLIVEESPTNDRPFVPSELSRPVADASIAIVGIGVAAAAASDRPAFVQALLGNEPRLDETGEGRFDSIDLQLKRQKFPPNDLKKSLGQQLAMLQVADEALADVASIPNATTGVYVGMGTDPEAARFGTRWRLATMAAEWGQSDAWLAEARNAVGPALDAAGVLGTMPNIVANRLNSQFDLAGPSFTVSSEERSGIDAVRLAARALARREIDAALVGASDLSCDPVHRAAAAEILAADRQVPGDAAAVLVLKRLDDATRDGDTIYAVITGDDGEERPAATMRLGLDPAATPLTPLFGHAHAASGIIHVAAGALLLHHRRCIGGAPLLASHTASGSGLAADLGPRTVDVAIDPMEAASSGHLRLVEFAPAESPAQSRTDGVPALRVFSGADASEVLANVSAHQESDIGPARLVIVAANEEQLSDRMLKAKAHIEEGRPAGLGVHFRSAPLDGEIAAVFTAAGAAYTGMGVDLLAAMPELATPSSQRFPLGEVADWAYGDSAHEPTPNDYLWGTALLSQAHAVLTRKVLSITMNAAIGYSSGESNSLYAFDVWRDMDAMRNEIDASGMMDRELGVEFAAVARAWGVDAVRWSVWNVLAPVAEVQSLVGHEPRVHVAIINTATDCVISGDSEACQRIVELVGRPRCVKVGYELACHTPEVAATFHQPWVDIHTRAVTPAPGVRHYSNGCAGAYDVSSARCAEVITAQAENTIDFPATIRSAYADGVRIFIEHGPAGACTNFIRDILSDRDGAASDVLAVQLDRKGASIEQLFDAAAALVAAGVAVDHHTLTERLTPCAPDLADPGPILSLAAHPTPVTLPPRRTELEESLPMHQVMAPAPVLPPVGNRPNEPIVVVAKAPVQDVPMPPVVANGHVRAAPVHDVAAVIQQQMAAITQIHNQFLADQAAMQQTFLASTIGSLSSLPTTSLPTAGDSPAVAPAGDSPAVAPAFEPAPVAPIEPAVDVAPAVVEVAANPSEPERTVPSGPRWNKDELEIHSSGKISEIFGPMFEPQDGFELQCRMPEPPLLLADRVTGMVATAGKLGQGTIWTETDVEAGAWYLNEGYMPAGFMIESGQADLMLISYMGIDLLNLGARSYRLLGCTLTYHGDLPSPGETLEYEIRITGHAKHGDIRLFFFEYDCIVDGQPRLTVRDAQAGFFTSAELEDALGVLWTPEDTIDELSPTDRVDGPAIVCTKQSFTQQEVMAFSEGRALECFGPGFEWTETHTRTPKIQSGPQLFIDEVTAFDPTGGPWGRGFMRCETKVNNDDWYFDGHFKNDPCMPGNFMVEACIEAMSLYLAALGHTAKRDGWRFQPLPEQPFELKCRGEINPEADHVAYELHVAEVWDGPHPTVICDVLGFVDGRPGFHAHRIGVELVPSWPLTSRPEIYKGVQEPVPVATDSEGFPFDWKAMISCAWGRPSEAFGSMYEMFDGTRRSPRLPGEPYHFISRITKIVGDLDVCEAGMEIECEYDIPADAWYFDENGIETMPYAVLLEAALQPCGWVASAIGSATGVDDDLLFRNLDGTATQHGELTRTSGTLTTKVKLKSVSRAGGMIIEGFDVECFLGATLVYSMTTVFGFFPPEAFEDQVGLPILGVNQARLDAPTTETIDLTTRPGRYCDGSAHLPEPMLLMLDRAGHSRGAGEAGLGIVRGEKDVDVSEWFFKAHFFQDPVQPGSLGIEALLQLLQFYMLDTGMNEGLIEPHFEPIQIDNAMSWKYRGQVTPENTLITSTMEITEVGSDAAGPFVIGTGSLWCDGLRIYEVENMGMRLVSSNPVGPSSMASVEVPLAEVKERMSQYWQQERQTPAKWLIEDLFDGLTDRYVNSVRLPAASTLDDLRGRPAIYLGNHQVQIESLVVSNLLPALTGVPMTTVAHMKHRHRWIGQAIAAVDSYPGSAGPAQIAYFDQAEPETMFELVNDVRSKMAVGKHSFFVHADGTRSQSSRDVTHKVSSVFIDLAIEMGVPIVPVRFSGGLPVEPIDGKAEVPTGHGTQDYWIGEPIEPELLASLPMKERTAHVVGAINTLGGTNANERPNPGDAAFAARVADHQGRTGVSEVFAAMWEVLEDCEDASDETMLLREAMYTGAYESDSTERGEWLDLLASLLLGRRNDSMAVVVLSAPSHPQLTDHVVDGVVVVPVVYALEWMMRAAAACRPDLSLDEVAEIKVLKGITLPGFLDGEATKFEVVCESVEEADGREVLLVRLSGGGRPHYSCRAVMTAQRSAQPAAVDLHASSPATGPVPYSRSSLFHGPSFRVLSGLGAMDDHGASATAIGVVDKEWPSEPWISDPALADGGLQLALLWTEHMVGRRSLPTSIGGVVIYASPAPGAFRIVLTAKDSTQMKSRCDVDFVDADGVTVCQLIDVETHTIGSA